MVHQTKPVVAMAVPPTGALHAVPQSLVERAQQENERVAVSVFPRQPAPGEGLDATPSFLDNMTHEALLQDNHALRSQLIQTRLHASAVEGAVATLSAQVEQLATQLLEARAEVQRVQRYALALADECEQLRNLDVAVDHEWLQGLLEPDALSCA